MPKLLHIISPLLLSSFLILLFACGKEAPAPTVINGKVTDKKSGLPIGAAEIDIDFRTDKQVSGSLVTEHDLVWFSTDAQGEFQYTHDADFTHTYSEIRKTGYVTQAPLKIKRGETNNLEIKLAPYDGTLRLEITNETGQFDSIYMMIENPSRMLGLGYFGIYTPKYFPVVLSSGEQHVEYLKLPSEEYTKIHWGFSYFPTLSASVFQDSVFLTLHDSTTYKLTY